MSDMTMNREEWHNEAVRLIPECPKCGSEYLHQGRVVVKNRSEDEDGLMFDVRTESVSVVKLTKDECDYRRDSIGIEFYCENCREEDGGNRYWMMILQHKGRTFVGWEKPKAVEKEQA